MLHRWHELFIRMDTIESRLDVPPGKGLVFYGRVSPELTTLGGFSLIVWVGAGMLLPLVVGAAWLTRWLFTVYGPQALALAVLGLIWVLGIGAWRATVRADKIAGVTNEINKNLAGEK